VLIFGQSQWPCILRHGSVIACLLELWVWIPPVAWMSLCCDCCVLSGRDPCNGPNPHLEESYWVFVSLSMIRCNNNPMHLQWVGRRSQNKKETRKKERKTQRIFIFNFWNIILFYISLSVLPQPSPLRTPNLWPFCIFLPSCCTRPSLLWHTLFLYPPHLTCVGMEDVELNFKKNILLNWSYWVTHFIPVLQVSPVIFVCNQTVLHITLETQLGVTVRTVITSNTFWHFCTYTSHD
jgi:hypothetical protein